MRGVRVCCHGQKAVLIGQNDDKAASSDLIFFWNQFWITRTLLVLLTLSVFNQASTMTVHCCKAFLVMYVLAWMLLLYCPLTHIPFLNPCFYLGLSMCLLKSPCRSVEGRNVQPWWNRNLRAADLASAQTWKSADLETWTSVLRRDVWKWRVCRALVFDAVRQRWLCWKQMRGDSVSIRHWEVRASEIVCQRSGLPRRSLLDNHTSDCAGRQPLWATPEADFPRLL